MDEKTQADLAQRWLALVAAGKARWMRRMSTVDGHTVADMDGGVVWFYDQCGQDLDVAANLIPDFEDPATLGCLESQVRERHGDDVSCDQCDVGSLGPLYVCRGFATQALTRSELSRAEAIIAALEAAS